MQKISINLLPPEITAIELEKSKKSKIVKTTALIIVLAILITGGSFGYGLLQSSKEEQFNQELLQAEAKVASLKDQEGYLSLVKQRLTAIQTLLTQQNKPTDSFNYITDLTSSILNLSTMQIDKGGNIKISGQGSLNQLSDLIDDLSDPLRNSGKVSKVRVENLTRAKDQSYLVELLIFVK